MLKRIHLIIKGQVQGVYYRQNTLRKGKQLELKGYVRNLKEGTVEVIAEGPEEKLKELIQFCENNPGESKVEKVNIKYEEPKNQFKDFTTKY